MTKRFRMLVAGFATLVGCQGTVAEVGSDPTAETMVDDLGNVLSPVSRAIVEANLENSQPMARVQTGPGQLLELYDAGAGRTMISGTGGLTPEVLALTKERSVSVDQFLQVTSQIMQEVPEPRDSDSGAEFLLLQQEVPLPGEPGFCDSGTFTGPGWTVTLPVAGCPEDDFTRCFDNTTGLHDSTREDASHWHMSVCSVSGATNADFFVEDRTNARHTLLENTGRFVVASDDCREDRIAAGLFNDCPDVRLAANSAGVYDYWLGVSF